MLSLVLPIKQRRILLCWESSSKNHYKIQTKLMLAAYLQDIFTPSITINPMRHHPTDSINISLHLQPNSNHPLTRPITHIETLQILAHKWQSVPGIDSITYRHLKEVPITLHQLLAAISILENLKTLISYFRYHLNLRTPYHLINLPNLPPHSAKHLKIIVNHLHTHLKEHNLLPLHQAGFRPSYNINDQFLCLTNQISNNYNTSLPSCLALFDLEKVFDKVCHQTLTFKLRFF